MKPAIILAAISCCLFSQATLAQQIYKWVDEHGKVHFSDKPVNKDAESITIKQQPRIGGGTTSPSATRPSDPSLTDKTLDAYAERRRAKEQEQAKLDAEKQRKEQLKKQCEEARKWLAFSEGKAQFTVDEQGERVYRTDEEIASKRAKRQADINKYCR